MKWQYRTGCLALLLVLAVLLSVPLLASLVGNEFLRPTIATIDRLMRSHRYREVTGYLLLALVLFEISLSLRKRTRLALPGNRRSWMGIHMLVGVSMVLAAVVHTGGRWGSHLNGWLLTVLFLAILTALLGKLTESFFVGSMAAGTPAATSRTPRLGRPPRRPATRVLRIRGVWLRAHILLVVTTAVLLGFHVLSVYYF